MGMVFEAVQKGIGGFRKVVAIKLIKEVITALKPWEEIAEKLKAMKGDVVKRQIGVGKKTNPVPTGVLSKEIEEELEKSKAVPQLCLEDSRADIHLVLYRKIDSSMLLRWLLYHPCTSILE